MPAFLGVDQQTVLQTINKGLSLLENHPIGPATAKLVDEVRNGSDGNVSQIERIKKATTDEELRAAVKEGSAGYIFNRLYDVFEYHAACNTDGHGLETFEAITRLGLNSGAMTMEFNQYDQESQDWLNTSRRKVMQLFNKISGKSSRIENAIQNNNPFKRYGLYIEELTYGDLNWQSTEIKDIRSKVTKALEPFYKSDEVRMTGIGIISRDPELQGIMFETTIEGAKAVAKAFPNTKVVDFENNVVTASKTRKPSGPKA